MVNNNFAWKHEAIKYSVQFWLQEIEETIVCYEIISVKEQKVKYVVKNLENSNLQFLFHNPAILKPIYTLFFFWRGPSSLSTLKTELSETGSPLRHYVEQFWLCQIQPNKRFCDIFQQQTKLVDCLSFTKAVQISHVGKT